VADFASLRLLLNTIARSSYTIDRLIRTSATLGDDANPFAALLTDAVQDTLDEFDARPPSR
jgi:anaerobic glycerol-3-phosphate dehydrogenase